VNNFRILAVATAALSLTVGTVACGDDDDDDSASNVETTEAGAEATTAANVTEAGASPTSASGAAAEGATITIADRSFGDPLTVAAGTTVTVMNDSDEEHTLTADDGSFDTGDLEPGATAELTFDEPGTFAFHCEYHSSMHGSITVT
jgi:plastocyanin